MQEPQSPSPVSDGLATTTSFEQIAAGVPDVIGAGVGADGVAVVPLNPGEVLPLTTEQKANQLAKAVSPEAIGHWLVWVTDAVAKAIKMDEAKITTFEKDLFATPLAIISDNHLPALLKKTDSPEWAMLGVALMTYVGRVGILYQMRKLTADAEKKTEGKPWGQIETPAAPAPAKQWGRSGTEPA